MGRASAARPLQDRDAGLRGSQRRRRQAGTHAVGDRGHGTDSGGGAPDGHPVRSAGGELMAPRRVHVDIGINGAFLTRRWEEPENWMRLTRELGYPYHSFCADVLDPFFSGDREFQLETAERTRAAARKHGVTIWDVYTGVATHRFHGLSHSDERARRRVRQWILECFDLCRALGTPRLGGHWDAFTVEVLEDGAKLEEA